MQVQVLSFHAHMQYNERFERTSYPLIKSTKLVRVVGAYFQK